MSVTARAVCARRAEANPRGPSSSRRWRDPSGRCRGVDRRQLLDRREAGRPCPVGLVDRHLGEPGQQLRAAVARLAAREQAGALVDEGGAEIARRERRIIEHRLQERDVRRHAADAELGQRALGAADRGREVATAAGQLGQHRVEVRADLRAGVDGAAVEADAAATRRAVGGDLAGVGTEARCRVLGGDPALERRSVQSQLPLGEPNRRASAPGDAHLAGHEIDVGDLLRHRVLDLDPRVHLDEDVLPARSPAVSRRNSTVPAFS